MKGSRWQRFTADFSRSDVGNQLEETAETVKFAAEVHETGVPMSVATSNMGGALSGVIEALKGSSSAVVQAGNLLIVN